MVRIVKQIDRQSQDHGSCVDRRIPLSLLYLVWHRFKSSEWPCCDALAMLGGTRFVSNDHGQLPTSCMNSATPLTFSSLRFLPW